VIISSWLRGVEMNPSQSVDEMLIGAYSITVIMLASTLFMIVLPAAVAFGAGAAAGSAAANALMARGVGLLGDAAKVTVSNAAKLGPALGRYTGSR